MKAKEDVETLNNMIEQMTSKLFGLKQTNKYIILNHVKSNINRLYKKNFNYDFIIQQSKKFNMIMNKFDYEIVDLFKIESKTSFSGMKFLFQLSNIQLFQFVKEFTTSDEESNSDDGYLKLKSKRQAIRSISYIPDQDSIFSHIAYLIDPETNLLVKYHQTMLEDVLFAVQQIDQSATNIDQLFSYNLDIDIPNDSPLIKIQPTEQMIHCLQQIGKNIANIKIQIQDEYKQHHFQIIIYHLTKCRQMLETRLQLWPFKFSYSFLFAEALDKNVFSCDDWELKKQEKMRKQLYLNWYMNTIMNQMFVEFDIKFNDFQKFIDFISNIFDEIPSIQFDDILSQNGQFHLIEIINKTKTNLIVRNQLNQEIDFYSLGQLVGYKLVIEFQQMIKSKFIGHLQKEYINFPFTFLYKLAFKFNDQHIKLSDKFSTIKQKLNSERSKLVVRNKQNILINRSTIIKITELQSKCKKSATVTAVVVYLHIFCQINFDYVKSEFTSVKDFNKMLQQCIGLEFQQKLLRNYNIQMFLILHASQEKFFHWQEFVTPGKLKITRNLLQSMFKGAQFASEQQNIQVLIQLHHELENIGKDEICIVLADVFELQVDQIQSPVFFIFEIFTTFIKYNLKMKYIFNSKLVNARSNNDQQLVTRKNQPLNTSFSLSMTKTKRDIMMEDLAKSFKIQ